MSPSATETFTAIRPPVMKQPSDQAAIGNYKEHLPITYDKDAEEGRKGYAAVKVSHLLDLSIMIMPLKMVVNTDNNQASKLPANLGPFSKIPTFATLYSP